MALDDSVLTNLKNGFGLGLGLGFGVGFGMGLTIFVRFNT